MMVFVSPTYSSLSFLLFEYLSTKYIHQFLMAPTAVKHTDNDPEGSSDISGRKVYHTHISLGLWVNLQRLTLRGNTALAVYHHGFIVHAALVFISRAVSQVNYEPTGSDSACFTLNTLPLLCPVECSTYSTNTIRTPIVLHCSVNHTGLSCSSDFSRVTLDIETREQRAFIPQGCWSLISAV